MSNNYPKEIKEFIEANQLHRKEALLLFDAEIRFQNNNITQSFVSQVHIVSMQDATALYVYEFFKTDYKEPEMYSSEDYSFTYHQQTLELRKPGDKENFLLTIKPVTNSN